MQISVPPSTRLKSDSESTPNPNPESGPRAVAHPTWKLALLPGETLLSKQSASRGTGNIASVGKVLANRTTLYKYLNPRVFVILSQVQAGAGDGEAETSTSSARTEAMCAAGSSTLLKAPCCIAYCSRRLAGCATCMCRWRRIGSYIIASMGQTAEKGTTKGWKMVTVELYEGKGVDDKTKRCVWNATCRYVLGY
ncbi:hypothetical protein HGRIS_001087 [Hohenbuehelia grisea]|uniref:Uncharacterized protein n=1 Tax=Hohenbuehelia grisea TaxID=104357 RepID=A0ABR3JN81_9AGAR